MNCQKCGEIITDGFCKCTEYSILRNREYRMFKVTPSGYLEQKKKKTDKKEIEELEGFIKE